VVSHPLSDSIHSPQQLLSYDLHRRPTAAVVVCTLALLVRLGMCEGASCIMDGELEMRSSACARSG